MTWPIVLFFVLQGVIFLAWAALAFRTLFHLRTLAVAETGRIFPGPLTFLGAVSGWLRDPDEALPRRLLAGMTFLLFALAGISSVA
ncbi:hypothetical protein [Roseisalinus antarcticus]|uniref:Uncharacterized protein n=1 Tax=Roseisalinus antarcticus TaxID=254357 RepID=A0A1Y5S722_9RHOB|nr:hypothetical protein [Roseisalinus antarcticus]SLN33429.1 hypothetical protein ROA7023_01204 [Roseisalinus antarcticus]